MDHLRRPKCCPLPLMTMPYLGDLYTEDDCCHTSAPHTMCSTCRVSNTGWPGFPARRGYSLKIFDGEVDPPNPPLKDSFEDVLFAWLYFGFLSDLIGPFFDPVILWSGNDDSGGTLDTTHLQRVLRVWTNHEDKEELEMAHQRMYNLERFCKALDRTPTGIPGLTKLLSPAAQVALRLLYEAIEDALFDATKHSGAWREPLQWYLAKDVLINMLLQNHWCPSQIATIDNSGSLMYYAAALGPRQPAASHKDCSNETCVEYDIDESSYETKHVDAGCHCDFMQLPTRDIQQYLEQDALPVITYSERDGLKMHGLHTRHHKSYVAISHVWSDGCGNPIQNALPKCQISRIQQEVDSIRRYHDDDLNIPWFMDTLCVPVSGPREARSKAISLTNPVYKGAEFVLVRDQELMQTSSDETAFGILFRFVFSRWATRLWTLVESSVGGRLFACLMEENINLLDPISDLDFGADRPFDRLLKTLEHAWLAMYVIPHTTVYRARRGGGVDVQSGIPQRLMDAMKAVANRTTSHKRDVIPCLASVIQLPSNYIAMLASLRGDNEGQIAEFLKIVGVAAPSLVTGDGPRLQHDGFRWCPADIVSGWSVQTDTDDYHNITKRGLRGPWDTVDILLPADAASWFSNNRYVLPNSTERFRLDLVDPTNDIHWTILIPIGNADEWLRACDYSRVILLMPILPQKVASSTPQDCVLVRAAEVSGVEGDFGRRITSCILVMAEAAFPGKELRCETFAEVGKRVWTID